MLLDISRPEVTDESESDSSSSDDSSQSTRGNMTGTPLNNDLAGDFAIAKRPPSNPIVLAG